jgi:glucose/arabinose dehydrogenase
MDLLVAVARALSGCKIGARRPAWPVGVAIDRHGALLVADDVGNSVWRVTAAAQ